MHEINLHSKKNEIDLKLYYSVQAFKIIVTDPDSVLNALTREVQEIGPDGQEVDFPLV